MKKIILALILCTIGKATAQSYTDGIFTTTFGNISWTSETGIDYPNGGIIYGDYKDKGTIVGKLDNNGKEVDGSFFNGSSEGKFIFMVPYGKNSFFDQGIKTFGGNWGYSSNNKYSSNAQNEWKVTGKIGEKDAIKNVTNVWSGKWNTTDGAMYLLQNGNKITGTYKGVGTVEATYNPATRFLKGTFKNNNINKIGYLEFYFEGNTFKGKWGWNASMTDGNWDGTKHVKNNKELSKAASANPNALNNLVSSNEIIKIRVRAVYAQGLNFTDVIHKNNLDLYGFVRFEVKKVTNTSSTIVNSFGNKSKYLFEKTEDNPLVTRQNNYNFPDQPTYYRDFFISKEDWNNNNINFELTVGHHLKVAAVGTNLFCVKQEETISLKKAKMLNNKHRTKPNDSDAKAFGGCLLDYYIEML